MAAGAYSVDRECWELHKLIDRLILENNSRDNSITFGVLFQDDICQQTFESLVGTMKAARKQVIF